MKIRNIVAQSLRAFSKEAAKILLSAALFSIPALVLKLLLSEASQNWGRIGGFSKGFDIFSLLPNYLAQLAINFTMYIIWPSSIFCAIKILGEQRFSFGESMRAGFRYVPQALLFGLALTIINVATALACSGVAIILSMANLTPRPPDPAGVSFIDVLIAWWSMILLMLYMFIFIIFLVALPVMIVERRGVLVGFYDNVFLTRGHRFSIFASVFILFSLYRTLSIIFLNIINEYLPTLEGDSTWLAVSLLEHGLAACFMSVTAVMAVVVYRDLRLVKDGIDIKQLSRTLD